MRKLKKPFAVLLVVITLLSTFSITAFAAETEENPSSAGQTTVTLKAGESLQGAFDINWWVTMMYADGKMAYCVDASLPHPDDGVYTTDNSNMKECTSSNTYHYEFLRKALYYCYGGDGFKKTVSAFTTDTSKHEKKYSGNTMETFMGNLRCNANGDVCLDASGYALHYLLSHRVIAYISGNNDWDYALNQDWIDAVKELAAAINNAPAVPITTKLFLLNPSKSGNKQRILIEKPVIRLVVNKSSSNPSKTDGNSDFSLEGAVYDIYLDSACKEYFGSITTDKNGYGYYGSGDRRNVSLQNYYAKEKTAPKGFALDTKVYQFKNSGKTYENIPLYEVNCVDEPIIRLVVNKSSSNPSITDGNSCYSLEGAVYDIYLDSACTKYFGSITTDKNGYGYYGHGDSRNVPLQDYFAKEKTAPKGYALDKTVYQFKNSGKTYENVPLYEISCKDIPQNDPVTVVLQKKDSVTGEATDLLKDAEFTLKYYSNYYSTEEEVNSTTPARTWVIKTDDRGVAWLDKEHLVSGDEFYYSSSENPTPCLPFGTLTIQETKAPAGYAINEELFIGQIKENGGLGWLTTNSLTPEGELLINEHPANGYIGVHKVNQDNEPVEGAVYGLYTSNEADSNGMLLESNRVATITTDVNGNGTFDYASPVGTTVYVQEITAPVGYELDRKVYETSPSAENVEITNPAIVNVVENVVTGSLKVVKTSDDGIVDNFWFSITDSNGKTYDNIRTQNGGIAELKNLPVYNKDNSLISYTVDELGFKQTDGTYSLPARYNKPEAVTQTLVENDTVTFSFNNAVKVGNLQIKKSSDDGIVENVWFRVTASNGKQYDDVCTKSSGTITMSNLPIYDYSGNKIEYTIEELGFKNSNGEYYFPKKYLSQSIRSTTLTENVYTVVSFSNETDYRGIQIKKTAYDGETDGLWFNVTDSLGNDYGNFETESGTAEINDLSIYDINDNLISYTITELGLMKDDGSFYLPERYIKTEPQTVTLDNTLESGYYEVVSFYNDYKLANIQVQKTSEDDVVEGIWFNISTTSGADCGNYQTDENGTIFETGFDIYDWDDNKITYVIKELGVKKDDGSFEVPYRYNTPKTQKLTLNYGEIGTVNFNNTLKKGSVSLTKTNDEGTKLNGVNYKLYDKSGTEIMLSQTGSSSYQYNTKGKALTLSTVNGKISVNNLPQGDYYFIETKCPAGYSLLKEPIYFTISGENESTLYRTIDVIDAKKVVIPNTGGNNLGQKYIDIGNVLIGFGLLSIIGILILKKVLKNNIKKLRKADDEK